MTLNIRNPLATGGNPTRTSTASSPLPSPTLKPSPTASISPTASPSFPVAVYAAVQGNYNGTIHNVPANLSAPMTLTINQNQAQISGQFTVNQPLAGSGPFTGTVDTNATLQFTVAGSGSLAPLHFQGTVHADHSLSGSYCSVNPQGQCDSNYGGSGTWQVSKV